jgi:hypothetical protein
MKDLPSNKFKGHPSTTDLVRAIKATNGGLLGITLTEGVLSKGILTAISGCKNLRCLLLDATSIAETRYGDDDDGPTDEALAGLLRSCPKLKFIFVQMSGNRNPYFGKKSWDALTDGCCPALEVLWVGARVGTFPSHVEYARKALTGTTLGRQLKLKMIFANSKLESAVA